MKRPAARPVLVAAVLAISLFGTLSTGAFAAQPGEKRAEKTLTIHIDATGPRVAVNPGMYGIFFEEINHAGDGGLYAELVQNRDFEANTPPVGGTYAGNWLMTPAGWIERKWFTSDLPGWYLVAEGGAKGSIRQVIAEPLNLRNPHSMRLVARQMGQRLAVANDGYWGMNFRSGEAYDLSFYARTEGDARFDLTVSLESQCGHKTYATAKIAGVGGPWKQYRATFRPDASDPKGRLAVAVSQPGTIWFDVVSLYPQKTFKNRPNGLRPDLAEALAELRPGFLRFPGGCVVEGIMLSNRFQWKNSIGEVAQRQGNFNLWGYYSTYGLGFHEYLQLCEDLKADAMYVVNAGMSCQARRPEYCKPRELNDYVQDTLDALEYAMGPAQSKWGAMRAAHGHPQPFAIKYVEIGNENGGQQYHKNYRVFYDAIKARYPQVITIADQYSMGGGPVEMADDHYYTDPNFFFEHEAKYDKTDRKGPKIYVGEYACNANVGHGNLLGALSEAVFMMGMERNADVVKICSYAPLFVNVNDRSWPVNLIEYDSSRVVGRSSYHVQRLFARNLPGEVLRTRVEPAVQPKAQEVYALAGLDKKTGELILKVVNRAAVPRQVAIRIRGLEKLGNRAKVTTLAHDDPTAENTLDDPDVVVPGESEFAGAGADFSYTFKPYSLTILRMGAH